MEGPFDAVVASDRSEEALALGRENGEEVEAAVDWRVGDLYDAARQGERFDVVVSNPPYVATGEQEELEPEVVDWEPAGALFAGHDGLDAVRRLLAGAPDVLNDGGLLAMEIGAEQGAQVLDLAGSVNGLVRARVERDLSGRERYLLVERRDESTGD